MKMNVDINEELLIEAMEYGEFDNISEAIEEGLHLLVRISEPE